MSQLVTLNGSDLLDKEEALSFFSGKSWNDVLAHLQSLDSQWIASAEYRLEEWCVLDTNARHYYTPAYLEFLLHTLSKNDPNGRYISELFHALYQTMFMYGHDVFNSTQKSLIRQLGEYTLERTSSTTELEDWKQDIDLNIKALISEFNKDT